MAAFLLTWNPDGPGWPDDDYADEVESSATGDAPYGNWSVGNRKSGIGVGDRAFLLRKIHERGLVASGYFTSEIYPAPHWDGSGRMATYADVEWDCLLPVEDGLAVSDLKVALPDIPWDRLQPSGVLVPQSFESELENLWSEQVAGTPYRQPGEYVPDTFEEGALTRVAVNRYERDRAARAACIAHHGTVCAVCGFDFERTCGKLGRDFIHVHHLREISTLGAGYKIDPVKEMRPLCANCHAMVHRERPLLTPKQLKARLKAAAKPH
jgi:5-methylcytosine-specific restriction enzyme A